MFGGEYNRVTATITHNGEVIHYLYGHWDSSFYLTDASKTQDSLFFDVTTLTVLPKKVLDVPYQGPYE